MWHPVVRRDRCDPAKPYVVCDLRRDAELNGEFFWDTALRGYVYTELPVRRASWRARFFHERAGLHDGERYTLSVCPFCGCELPNIQAIADSTCDSGEGAE